MESTTVTQNSVKSEHLRLAAIIKECHEDLREQTKLHGGAYAWEQHVHNTARLQQYADAMHRLASIWESNSTDPTLLARSRVKWTIDYCLAYFFTSGIYLEKRAREERLAMSYAAEHSLNASNDINYSSAAWQQDKVHVLDVGSCFNPFLHEPRFDVTAIDLCPATADVLKGDFLRIILDDEIDVAHGKMRVENGGVVCLQRNSFECVIFSLLLEYIPTPEERLQCCRKAYELLRPEGILIIITPDSQHVGKNAKLMKTWRYALGTFGFFRICFEKLPHITCMVFRKALNAAVAQRWAELHREEYMTVTINIPQDF